jgi:hypothetical protein
MFPSRRAEGRIFEVQFEYSTDTNASAVQWIEARGTKGGVRVRAY